jgi:tryptophan synthase beta chain
VILFNLSGHGNFDLSAYNAYLGGQLENYSLPEEVIQNIPARLPVVNLQ